MIKRRISEIWIYPIKSLAGVRLHKAIVKKKGLQFDRRWMLVDKEGRFLTQREHPEMALFRVAMDNEFLVISRPQLNSSDQPDSITLNLTQEVSGNIVKVQIWEDEVEVVEADSRFSSWFSKYLNIECRLVFFPEKNPRDVDPDYVTTKEQVSLADGYPFLIIGQSSLDELNLRLKKHVSMKRFRPNFIFVHGLPNEEDSWRNFLIGSVTFEGVKPCSRCVLTTVNPETGEKGDEPLKTLSGYRKDNGKINFGENLLARTNGEVSEGDVIEIIDLKK